jgi:hypothetical protein
LILVALATTLGALAFTAAPALAAAPEAPKTEPATAETATTATAHGVLDPLAASPELVIEYDFFYAPRGALCTEGATAPEPAGLAPGAEGTAVEQGLLSLEPSTEYAVCLAARNVGEATWTDGNEVHFTTKPAPPKIQAEYVSGITTSAVRLEAVVNANNQEVTECHFEYGADPTLATNTAVGCEPATLTGVFGGQGVGVTVSGLTQQSTYYFRVVVKNAGGEKEEGTIEHFTTSLQTPKAEPPSPLAGTTATLRGVLSPTATAPGEAGTYEFIYRQSGQSPTECEGEGETKSPEPPGVALGLAKEAVSAPLTGLLPNTEYTFCLLARNSTGEVARTPPETFTTLTVAPTIESESTADVSATEARLQATVDPGGLETAYHFEYGPAAGSYDVSIPVPDAHIAAGVTGVSVNEVATGLEPGTTYHYRVVATNAQSPAGGTPGPDQTFTTLASVGTGSPPNCPNEQLRAEQPYGLALPDCRAYEMVSPLDKNDSNIAPESTRASVSGEAVTYQSRGSFAEPAGALFENRYISRRGPDGWSTQNITPPHGPYNTDTFTPFEELLFTPDLSKGLLRSEFTPLTSGSPAGYVNLYVADTSDGSYQSVTGAPPGLEPYGYSIEPRSAGVSTDLSHIVFEEYDRVGLTPGASPDHSHVYEWADGKLSLVDVAPEGVTLEAEDSVGVSGGSGPLGGDVWHAVSADGSRVFFTGGEGEGGSSAVGQLYVRENVGQPQSPYAQGKCAVSTDACTVEVSASQRTNSRREPDPDPNGPGPARYWDASAEGQKVFFTSRVELTNDANTGKEDNAANLYEYDLETGVLSDLTVDTGDANGAAVLGLVTAGEDGSYVYFVANGVLAENAKPGDCIENTNEGVPQALGATCNLYLYHSGNVTFVATLASGDERDWVGTEPQPGPGESSAYGEFGPGSHTVRVTPDGTSLAFQSERGLTGYDNEPAEPADCTYFVGGKTESTPCREVYLYDAAAGLTCVSCDPSGARPVGDAELGGHEEVSENFGALTSFYVQRNLSEDGGRLFFQSSDPLVPHASNGRENVYEYEGGHVYPISDVAGNYESFFLDASPSGNDVFIATADQLLPQDRDQRVNVYDVRVGGGFPVSVAPPPCNNGDSCKGPVSPQPGVFGAPASATFSGAGNVAGGGASNQPAVKPKAKPAKCKKGYVKNKKGKCVKRVKKPKKKAKKPKKSAKGRK